MDGVSLSAFNLMLPFSDKPDKAIAVEVLYQGCKCFDGKPRSDSDRFDLDSRSARARAANLDAQQVFTGWYYKDSFAGLSSGTMFYDLLYLTALIYNEDLLKVLLRYDCFTDIEFNPKKSFACQARTAALAVSAESMEIKVNGLVKQIAAQIFQSNNSGRLSDKMNSDAGINQLRLFRYLIIIWLMENWRPSGEAPSACESPCRRQCPGRAAPGHRRTGGGQHRQAHRTPTGGSASDRHARHPPGRSPLLTGTWIVSALCPHLCQRGGVSLPPRQGLPDQGAGELAGAACKRVEVDAVGGGSRGGAGAARGQFGSVEGDCAGLRAEGGSV